MDCEPNNETLVTIVDALLNVVEELEAVDFAKLLKLLERDVLLELRTVVDGTVFERKLNVAEVVAMTPLTEVTLAFVETFMVGD